jgi:hypothetical protein
VTPTLSPATLEMEDQMFGRLFPLVALLLAAPLEASAHHKPGHNPPGQQKKAGLSQRAPFVLKRLEGGDTPELKFRTQESAVLPLDSSVAADEFAWGLYQDPDFGFTIEVPATSFAAVEGVERGMRFDDVDGDGQLDIYGGFNAAGLTPAEIADELERNPQIGEIAYRAQGANWIVLSGYYTRDDYVGTDLIFYAKFMFNADRTRLSAFEISYPERDREAFDPIVERLEATLTAPL